VGRNPKEGRPEPVGVPGVRARVVRGPRPDGTWYWRTEFTAGPQTGEPVEDGTFWATRKDAGRKVAQLVADGAVVAPKKRVRKAASAEKGGDDTIEDVRTVDQLLRTWRAHIEDTRPELAEGTMKAYVLREAQIRDAGFGNVLLTRLDAAAMEDLRAALLRLREGLAPRTVNSAIGSLTAAWKWGRREGLTPDRDLLVELVEVKDGPKATPSTDDAELVLERIRIPWARTAALIMWHTGMRIGEVAAIMWADVDLDRGTLHVHGKGARDRVVPIEEIVADLRAWKAWNPRPDRPELLGVSFNTVRENARRRITEACEAAGVPRFTPHAYRRTAVDGMLRDGVDVKSAAKLMGHTEETMLTYYRQVTDDDLRNAARSLGRRRKKK
jgi:integrase